MALKSSASSVRVTSRPASTNGKPTSSSAPSSRRGSVDQGVVAAKPATKLATNAPSDKKNKENSKPVAAKEPEPQIMLSDDDLAKMKAATDALSDIIEQGQIAAEELREAETHELPRLAERGRRRSKDLKEQAMKFLEEELEPVFKLMDTSGDGQLDQKELKRAFDLVGRPTSDEAIERAIKELDQNNDGLVNLQEFKAIAWATAVDSAPETGAAAA